MATFEEYIEAGEQIRGAILGGMMSVENRHGEIKMARPIYNDASQLNLVDYFGQAYNNEFISTHDLVRSFCDALVDTEVCPEPLPQEVRFLGDAVVVSFLKSKADLFMNEAINRIAADERQSNVGLKKQVNGLLKCKEAVDAERQYRAGYDAFVQDFGRTILPVDEDQGRSRSNSLLDRKPRVWSEL